MEEQTNRKSEVEAPERPEICRDVRVGGSRGRWHRFSACRRLLEAGRGDPHVAIPVHGDAAFIEYMRRPFSM